MSGQSSASKTIGYSAGAALGASLLVLLLGMLVLGFDPALWGEWEGRFVGVAGAIAGIAGAVVGLIVAGRSKRRTGE